VRFFISACQKFRIRLVSADSENVPAPKRFGEAQTK
jgi:hypothetical protein